MNLKERRYYLRSLQIAKHHHSKGENTHPSVINNQEYMDNFACMRYKHKGIDYVVYRDGMAYNAESGEYNPDVSLIITKQYKELFDNPVCINCGWSV